MAKKNKNILKLRSEKKKPRKKTIATKKGKIVHKNEPTLNNSQWQSFFKYSQNIIFIVNKKLEIIDINKLEKGYTKKNVVGTSVLSFISQESQKTMKRSIASVFKTGKHQQYLCDRITPAGQKKYYSNTATPIIINKKVVAVIIEATDVTKNIENEKKLEVSESKFRMLAENAVDIISRYQVYPEPKLEYISPSVKKITGYSPKDFYNDPHFGSRIIHPEDLKILAEMQKKSASTFIKNKPQVFVARWIRKDGKIIWIETINNSIFDSSNKLVAVEAVGRDITERKKLEEEKKQSEKTFTQVLDNINELVYYVEIKDDGTRKVKYLGKQIEKLLGITQQQYQNLGKKLLDYCHPDDVASLMEKASKLKQNKKAEQFVFRFKNPKTKKYIWLEERITPQFDTKGKHIGNFGITADVTDRIESEERTKQNEEKFRMLAENAMDVIYRYTILPQPRYEYISPSVFKMSGYTPEDFYKDPFIAFKIVHPDDLHLLGDSEESLKEKNKISGIKEEQVVLRWIKKDGSIIWTETRTYDIFDKEGNKIAIEGISRDVTTQKHNELKLKESEERFKMLSNVAFEGIVFSENGIIVDVNDQFLKMFGYKKIKEVVGKDMIEDFVVDEQKGIVKKYAKINSSEPLEILVKRKNNSVFTVETKSQNIDLENKTLRATVIYDVTKRKQNELALNQSIENYKSLVDYSPDGVMIHVDSMVKFANPSALKMVGANDFSVIKNQSFLTFVLPEFHELIKERLKIIKTGKILDFLEVKIKRFDGQVVILETKSIPIKFNGENAIQVVFHDVTDKKQLLNEQLRAQLAEETNQKLQKEINERRKTEAKLSEAQKYSQMLIDSSLDMICASDRKGNIIEFNNAALKTFGYSFDEIIGKNVSILYANPSDRIKITDDELYVKGTYAGEVVNKKKNGELFVAYLSASVLKDDDGNIIGAMGVSRDISELKRAEMELKESEELLKKQSAKLNAVIESSSHVIWTIDKNHTITSFNRNFSKHLEKRYGKKAYIGLCMVNQDMITSQKYNQFWIGKYESVFKGNSEYFETELIDKNGELVWREIFLNPIKDEKGNVVEISGIGHDITEKKLAEEKIKQSLQEKEVLLKEVHHRVKNNLQVISSILNLQSSYVKDSSTLNILKESQNRIKSMAFIHESLYQTKDFTSINFSEYVVNLANNLVHSYSNIEQEIKLTLDIQNVFLNLDLAIPCGLIINEIVSNALKYAFVEKKGDAEIKIQMQSDTENLKLLIGDNGIGLPKTIDYRNTESLGLQLVVTLTDQLNGTIDLDTKNGTTYTIIFNQNQAKNRI